MDAANAEIAPIALVCFKNKNKNKNKIHLLEHETTKDIEQHKIKIYTRYMFHVTIRPQLSMCWMQASSAGLPLEPAGDVTNVTKGITNIVIT